MGGRSMGEKPDHDREEGPDWTAAWPENTRARAKEGGERWAEDGGKLRAMSRSIAAVAAGVLIGGGTGLLVGAALGVINPFVFGFIGIAAGVGASILMSR